MRQSMDNSHRVRESICIYIYTYIYVCIHINIYIYTCIYTNDSCPSPSSDALCERPFMPRSPKPLKTSSVRHSLYASCPSPSQYTLRPSPSQYTLRYARDCLWLWPQSHRLLHQLPRTFLLFFCDTNKCDSL